VQEISVSLVLSYFWKIIAAWWWLFFPFLIFQPARYLYRFYLIEKWDATQKRVVLEIKIPKEILKPIRAMDQVFAGFHGIHDIATWREKWVEGVYQLSLSFEIVSRGGEIHFYIRTPEVFRSFIESNIYSQYPEAEISLVDDYTKHVPQDIPNKDWDLWGVDYINSKDEIYPIKTYRQFETETEKEEEKRIDPLANLLEGLTTLKPDEQFWIQIVAKPVLGRDKPWQERGRALADRLAKRPATPKPKSMIQEAAQILITGKVPEEKKPEEGLELIAPELRLTPGEKEILTAVEAKLAKFGYDCNVRFIYLGKREVFFKPTTKIGFGFLKAVSTENLGGLKPLTKTMTKVKSVPFWFLDKRRYYLRQRRIFRYYKSRLPTLFPRLGRTYILNTEELATLYHFPGEMVAPAMGLARVEVKKGGPPSELPIE